MLTDFTKAFRAARKAQKVNHLDCGTSGLNAWQQQAAALEKACQEAKTTKHFDALLEHFSARDIGSHIADWAEEAAYHPHESAGFAMIRLHDGAILTQWNDAGFYHTETMGEDEALKIIEEANAEWCDEEAEEETEA